MINESNKHRPGIEPESPDSEFNGLLVDPTFIPHVSSAKYDSVHDFVKKAIL
jgi:hypothetical protein